MDVNTAADPDGVPVKVKAATKPERMVDVFPCLVHLNADTPAHASAACVMGCAAEKGCGRCWICTRKSKNVPAPPGSESPTKKVALSSNSYPGYTEPASFQPFDANGALQEMEYVQLGKVQEDGTVQFDRAKAAELKVSDEMYNRRAELAAWVIEDEMKGYHDKCRKTKTALTGSDLEGAPASGDCFRTVFAHGQSPLEHTQHAIPRNDESLAKYLGAHLLPRERGACC